jgi:hypothetical protein
MQNTCYYYVRREKEDGSLEHLNWSRRESIWTDQWITATGTTDLIRAIFEAEKMQCPCKVVVELTQVIHHVHPNNLQLTLETAEERLERILKSSASLEIETQADGSIRAVPKGSAKTANVTSLPLSVVEGIV